MDVKNAKVLDNGRRILHDWKRTQVAQSAKLVTGATCKLVSQNVTLDEPADRHCKRVRSGGCKNSCRCSSRKSVIRNYSNFMKSGLPQRVMFYQNGDWIDLPEEILAKLKGDFQVKKAITEVAIKGKYSLFDFLYMVKIDMETGLQQPIAWIDQSKKCFFPVLYSDDNDLHHRLCSDGEDQDDETESNGGQKIKLQLEVAINGDYISKLEECDEASVSRAKRRRIEEKDFSSNGKLDLEFGEGIGENAPCLFSASENYAFEYKHGELDTLTIGGRDYNAIQNMFLGTFAPLVNADNIVGIFCASPKNNLVQTRLQLFQKQVEIMKTQRGDANVRYAWFFPSKEAVSRIMFHRFEHTKMPKFKSSYGTGIHLIPANYSRISINHLDVDENGTQHMLLCRVVMGNMELIRPGSDQSHPSSENYDSGVDDLQNPNNYVIWDMYMNSHIYPEYVVDFRVPPKEFLVPRESNMDVSGITNSSPHCNQMQYGSAPVGSVRGCHKISAPVKQSQEKDRGLGPGVPKTPSSPWMPFPMLLDAISCKIPSKDMKLVNGHYDAFKRKKLSRVEFIIKLRSIIGDDLLKDTIRNLQHKSSSTSNCGSVVNK